MISHRLAELEDTFIGTGGDRVVSHHLTSDDLGRFDVLSDHLESDIPIRDDSHWCAVFFDHDRPDVFFIHETSQVGEAGVRVCRYEFVAWAGDI